ncbi:MAG: methionine aminopeptidase methionyl aminopeptidase [Parcubacteria group bacterium]|nr:methionine aminopeptidase methionyl aminopeptidase [Parcubacteria group bacterium]
MIATTEEQKMKLREAGKRLGEALEAVEALVAPGVSTQALEDEAVRFITSGGDVPAFLDYTPEGANRPYPAALCVSINEEVVHGIPNESPRTLKEGDIVSLDLGLIHEGYVVDSALTVAVGKTDPVAYSLMNATQNSLEQAIQAARPGNRIGDISHATEKAFVGTGFAVVKALGGHGVGAHVHEDPFIANAGHPGTGPEIMEGMVLAIEPIANEGKASVVIASDGYTYRTKDGSRSAHFEHTIIVGKDGAEVITRRSSEK